LHAERDLLLLRVDLQHHRFDLIAQRDDLARVSDVPRPAHLGDVDQPLNTLLQLDERAVVRDRYDTTAHPGTDRVLLVDVRPRVLLELLEAERKPLTLPIDVEDLHIELLADRDDL